MQLVDWQRAVGSVGGSSTAIMIEAVFDAIRPMVFNAIPDLGAARPDFLDRALIVEFSELKPEMRRDEARFWHEFELARPRILGALLNAATSWTWEPAKRQRSISCRGWPTSRSG